MLLELAALPTVLVLGLHHWRPSSEHHGHGGPRGPYFDARDGGVVRLRRCGCGCPCLSKRSMPTTMAHTRVSFTLFVALSKMLFTITNWLEVMFWQRMFAWVVGVLDVVRFISLFSIFRIFDLVSFTNWVKL